LATNTTNYNIVKPAENENADVAVINSNMDIIDGQMKTNHDLAAGKQDPLTYDTEPTENSTKMVKSGGIFSYIKTKVDALTALINGKQATLTFDSTPTSGSTNPVTSGGVYTGLAGKAASTHTHSESQITNLTADLALKGNTQTYTITDSTTLTIPTTAWVANTNSQAETAEKTDYPYMAILTIPSSLTGGKAVTADDTGESFPNYADSISENFFKHAYTTAGGLIIEAVTKPTAAMTLLQVKIERRLS